MFATFEGNQAVQAEIEHEDGVFTYPDGIRLTQAEHIAKTGTAAMLLEHDIVTFKVQSLSETVAQVYLDHTLRTTFSEFPFDNEALRKRMETGCLWATHFTFVKTDRGWKLISMDAHEVQDGYVPRDQRTSPNISTYPAP